MKNYNEAKCPNGHDFLWMTGTPFVCPICGYSMYLDNRDTDPGCNELTYRELELLTLLAIGFSNRHLALALSIETGTVETHLHRIFRKLQVTSRVQAARYAWDNGITWEHVQRLKRERKNENK